MERAIGARNGFQMARDEGKSQAMRIDAAQEKTILRLANRERDPFRRALVRGCLAADRSILKP